MSIGSIGNLLVSTAGHFEINIDHRPGSAYLKSVEGGHVKSSVVDEPTGGTNDRIKHTAGVAEVEPIIIDLGLSGADQIVSWVQGSLDRKHSRISGEIIHANFDLKPVYIYQFFDALLHEVTFPALDGNSKEPGYIKVKFQPERMKEHKLPGVGPSVGGLLSPMSSKQKMWSCSQFRLTIDGIPDFAFTNHIDSFTIKQGTKPMHTGLERFPQHEPTKVEIPHITGTMAAGYANAIIKWHEDTTRKGSKDPSVQKHGVLEFLGPDRITPIFAIHLKEVGLFGFQMQQSTANADAIKRVKFELYVGGMNVDNPSKWIGML
jgi:hypothetical protein